MIVLAAGASVRMGQPKQLLRYESETLLSRAIRVGLETPCRPLIVVLGSDAETLREGINASGARIVVNQAWAEGMGSSIRCGLRALETETVDKIEAAIFMLCDQPLITSAIVRRLADAYDSRQTLLVASEYEMDGDKTRGVPALFSRTLFPELMELRGAQGAKSVIERHATEATVIAVPEAAFDIDTADDYRALQDAQL
jgi:molybdenum cofactor cytidylyltransferase